MKTWINLTAVALFLASTPLAAQTSMSGGTGGSAAVGGTSASTVGTGGTSTSPTGTGSSIARGGSAGAGHRKAQAGGPRNPGKRPGLKSHTPGQAPDGGALTP